MSWTDWSKYSALKLRDSTIFLRRSSLSLMNIKEKMLNGEKLSSSDMKFRPSAPSLRKAREPSNHSLLKSENVMLVLLNPQMPWTRSQFWILKFKAYNWTFNKEKARSRQLSKSMRQISRISISASRNSLQLSCLLRMMLMALLIWNTPSNHLPEKSRVSLDRSRLLKRRSLL